MATLPTTFAWHELIIEVSNGATPEVFVAPCGLTSKSFNGQSQTNDTVVPFCDDPSLPAWTERTVVSLTRDITGSGVLAGESVEFWDDWWQSGQARNCRVSIEGGVLGSWQWAGEYVLTGFEIGANIGDGKMQVSVTLASSGQITRTDS